MHGSRGKIPVKNLVRQRCEEGFNSGVKGLLNISLDCGMKITVTSCSARFWLCAVENNKTYIGYKSAKL
jgi:hypothetical protein